MSTQGDGMAEVTEADREKAVQIAFAMQMVRGAASVLPIAAALAEEREKAQARFLAVAEQYESHVRAGLAAAAVDIRRAAEVTK